MTKKATNEAVATTVEETTTEAVESTAENTKAEKPEVKMVDYELFKDNKDYKDDVFVCINGKNIVVKRGEKVKIPEAYKKVLEQSRKQDNATADLMASKQDEYRKEAAKV